MGTRRAAGKEPPAVWVKQDENLQHNERPKGAEDLPAEILKLEMVGVGAFRTGESQALDK